jgi:hypothetical protein
MAELSTVAKFGCLLVSHYTSLIVGLPLKTNGVQLENPSLMDSKQQADDSG